MHHSISGNADREGKGWCVTRMCASIMCELKLEQLNRHEVDAVLGVQQCALLES